MYNIKDIWHNDRFILPSGTKRIFLFIIPRLQTIIPQLWQKNTQIKNKKVFTCINDKVWDSIWTLPEVISILCLSSSSRLIFSSSSLWIVSKSKSFSLCENKHHQHDMKSQLEKNRDTTNNMRQYTTSQCWLAACISQSYLFLTDSKQSSRKIPVIYHTLHRNKWPFQC